MTQCSAMSTYIKGPTTKKSKTLIPIVYPILLITSSSFMSILKVGKRIETNSKEIEIEIEWEIEKRKKGLHGNRTRDLSHPKRESYH